jgi:hypothetical protein
VPLEHLCVVARGDHDPCLDHVCGVGLICVCLIGAESASASSLGAGGGGNGCGGCGVRGDDGDLNSVQRGMHPGARSELVRAFWLFGRKVRYGKLDFVFGVDKEDS